jgi:hypothetical protein
MLRDQCSRESVKGKMKDTFTNRHSNLLSLGLISIIMYAVDFP